MPVVSVILPVYNGERFLKEAVDSILVQTFTDFELIIVDDCSMDSTSLILTEYATRDTRIRVMRQSRNMGIVEALNTGSHAATGQYIARMDVDDISLPERFERQVEYLNSHPDVGVLGTGVQLIDVLGKKQTIVTLPPDYIQIYWSLFFCNPIVHPTVMMRRDLFLRARGYRTGYPEDYDLWRRMASLTRLANLPEVLLLLRKHLSNLSLTHEAYSLASAIRVIRELILNVLGKNVSADVVEILYDPNCMKVEQRWQAARLLEELSKEFISRFTSSQVEKDFIIQDTADRLASLALRRISFESIILVFRATRYSPSTVFKALKRFLWAIKNRTRSQ